MFIPQTSVAVGVLAALVEDWISNTGQKSVRGNWPLWSAVVSSPPTTTTTYHHLPQPPTTNDKYNTKAKRLITNILNEYKIMKQ